ncbi:hypothetical protein OAI40_03240 [Candidatus Pseudothioglobus singularis]|nr:hypothetical protein [Candidatus Pseudothioglobus singularis]MDB4598211.1 hypothetical protein [Candidatus Pseudothioglobus singularis]|tara:strand:+ start:1477 stop:2445 length:969 start_codon:yes stop_codon:yes gene_type:complete
MLNKVWSLAVFIAALLTASILLLQPQLSQVVLLPDQGASWYFWKRTDPNFASQATAWGGYLVHQLFIWGIISWAQRNRGKLQDRTKMHAVNWVALVGTAAFGSLHFFQTAIWYDGLAQNVSVFSSQASVILLLVIVLMIEAPRRGLFFGSGGKKFAGIRPFLIRYHGYYFSWAVVYTFWFHPMETSWGHLFGFFYTFLLMIQAGFIFTRVHTNRWWTLTLETLVLFHGVVVALIAGQEFWTMFLFGFLMMFIVTQMHGLGLSNLIRWIFGVLFIISLLFVYSERGWNQMNEILRIPVIDYLLVFVLAGLVILIKKLARKSKA